MSVFTEDGLPRGEEKVERVENMFDRIAPSYDRVNRIMTFGLDQRWRKRTLRRRFASLLGICSWTWPAAPGISRASPPTWAWLPSASTDLPE